MINDKKILAIIPARGGSKGIKLKNLCKINDKSLTELAIRVAQNISFVDKIVVSTDHPSIVVEAEKCGIAVPSLRPQELSGDRISDIDVLADALIRAEKENDMIYDIIVMLQPTSPLRTVDNVVRALNRLVDDQFSSVWSISETDSKAHPLKQLILDGENLDYYDDAGATIIARQELLPTYHRNGVVYAFTRNCILVDKNKMGTSCGYILIEDFNVSIDTLYDIDLINYQINAGNISKEAAVFL